VLLAIKPYIHRDQYLCVLAQVVCHFQPCSFTINSQISHKPDHICLPFFVLSLSMVQVEESIGASRYLVVQMPELLKWAEQISNGWIPCCCPITAESGVWNPTSTSPQPPGECSEPGRPNTKDKYLTPQILFGRYHSSSKAAFRAANALPSSNILSRVATARLTRCASTSARSPAAEVLSKPLTLSRIPLQPLTTNTRIEERALHLFRHPMPPNLCPQRKQSRISPITRHHRALNHIKVDLMTIRTPDMLTLSPRRNLNCLVQNEPGVLSRVSGILAGRGFNIDSLVVCRTEIRDLSRVCIVISGQEAVVEQARRQA